MNLWSFGLREEDMVTKWWAIFKTLWHIEETSASCFSLLFLLNIHTSVFATVSPWTAIVRGIVRNGNSLQYLNLLKHQEFLFAFVPQGNTTVSWGIKSREEDEYRSGEVSNMREEKVVPFKKCIKILYSALIYHFATCFPFEALEAMPRSRCQEKSVGSRNKAKYMSFFDIFLLLHLWGFNGHNESGKLILNVTLIRTQSYFLPNIKADPFSIITHIQD